MTKFLFTLMATASLGLTFILSSIALPQSQDKSAAPLSEQARYRLAADYSRGTNGHAVVILKGGKIAFEQYDNGFSAEKGHRLASGAKSFCGAMAVAAAQDGLLKLDEKVADTLTEWQSDSRKSRITVRQLLSLTGGLDAGQIARVPSYAQAIQARALHEPGTTFQYGPVPFQVFGEVMRRKLASRKLTPLDYLKQRIFEPIGMKIVFWRHDEDGNPHLPSGAILMAREWARFGELIKNGGRWQGKQLLSKDLLSECFKGTEANPAYGLTFWLSNRVAADKARGIRQLRNNYEEGQLYAGGPKDLVMAAGAGKQRLYIIPSLDMVIERLGEGAQFKDTRFLALLLDGRAIAD